MGCGISTRVGLKRFRSIPNLFGGRRPTIFASPVAVGAGLHKWIVYLSVATCSGRLPQIRRSDVGQCVQMLDAPTESRFVEADELLMARVAKRDSRAFDEFHRRYAPRLLNFLIQMMGNVEDAEDVVQETFWQAWQSSGVRAPSRSTPVAWIFIFSITCCRPPPHAAMAVRAASDRFTVLAGLPARRTSDR